MRIIKKGAASQSLYFSIADSTSGTGGKKTGLAFNTSSLTAYYCRVGAAAVSITLATQTANGAWSSGGFVEVDGTNMPGLYRLDVPDAAFASGADAVVVTLKGATGMVQVDEIVQLVAFDLQDSVRLGLTALPNAAAGANGGLPTGDAAGKVALQADQAVNVTKVNGTAQTARDLGAQLDATVSSRLATSGYTAPDNASIAAIKAKTDNLPPDPADASDIAAAFSTVNGTLATIAGYVDTEVAAIKAKTDNLPASPAATSDIPSAATIAQAVWDALTSALTTVGSIGKLLVTNVDAAVSSRLASVGYTAPDNAGIAAIQAKTDNLPSDPADQSLIIAATNALGTSIAALPTATQNADALLDRDMATGTDSGSTTVRTVRQALRFLRNKWAIVGATLTVYKEDDTTASWSSTVTGDANAHPIVQNDPAG